MDDGERTMEEGPTAAPSIGHEKCPILRLQHTWPIKFAHDSKENFVHFKGFP